MKHLHGAVLIEKLKSTLADQEISGVVRQTNKEPNKSGET
jgi:hypothetical protein